MKSLKTLVTAILILSFLREAFWGSEFSAFWNKFKSGVIAGDKASVADMAKFPLSMPYLVKAVKNKQDFLHRYYEIFKGEAERRPMFRERQTAERIRPALRSLLPVQGNSQRLGKRADSLHL